MEKLNYIEIRIEEVKKSIKHYEYLVKIKYWEETTVSDLKKELAILESIRDDYKVKV